jgi:hypothetical protein
MPEVLCCCSPHPHTQVIKKHDKLTSSCLKESYWPLIEERYPESRKDRLQRGLERLEDLYAILFADGDLDTARTALSQNLRQHIQVSNGGAYCLILT